MAFSVPSLKRVCVIKIVKEIKGFCFGTKFEDIGKSKFIVGPFENLSSQNIEAIFEYLISIRQLNATWLSLLIVTHLRAINFKQFPAGVNPQLFKILLNRCKLLERLIIPNCKKIPNKTLCNVLKQNPSLLQLDISNKVSPKVDVSIVDTLARSCRYLTVLKLSDYRVEDPRTLLVLCGKRVVPESPVTRTVVPGRHAESDNISNGTAVSLDTVEYHPSYASRHSIECTPSEICPLCGKKRPLTLSYRQEGPVTLPYRQEGPVTLPYRQEGPITLPCRQEGPVTLPYRQEGPVTLPCRQEGPVTLPYRQEGPDCFAMESCSDFPMELETLKDQLSTLRVPCSPLKGASSSCSIRRTASNEHQDVVLMETASSPSVCRPPGVCRCVPVTSGLFGSSDSKECVPHSMEADDKDSPMEATREEQENQRVGGQPQPLVDDSNLDMQAGESDEDLYENDGILTALNVEDHSMEYGCLDLETLWLDNVNINDPVMAILMQNLPRLRDLNLSDTDICNPWRLLDPSCTAHLVELEDLDIKSTALSRTALEMIPKFHPDLHKFAISSTTLPPHTYANIGRLTGVADLELIGGQFYPCEPKEIFDKGIAPAICGIGKYLRSLNLTYFAHVEFEVIPKSCPKLEHLDLSFTSTSLWYPCDSLGDCCPHLRTLNLAFCHIEASEGSVNDPQPVSQSKALQKMIGQPRNLVELNISGSAVGDDTLKSIFPTAVHPLQVLDLSRCSVATVEGVEYIWNRCPFLHKIDLTYCREITVDDSNRFEKKCFEERPLFKLEGKLVWK